MSEIRQVPYWEIDSCWAEYSPMIQKAINIQDEWTLESVYKHLINPTYNNWPMQLWVIPGQFALVTQIQTFPSGVRKCLLFLGGGENLPAIRAAHSKVSDWAKRYHGCTKFMIYGRRGFLKSLEGFTELSTVMECKL